MGKVYRARDMKLERDVAIKVLQGEDTTIIELNLMLKWSEELKRLVPADE